MLAFFRVTLSLISSPSGRSIYPARFRVLGTNTFYVPPARPVVESGALPQTPPEGEAPSGLPREKFLKPLFVTGGAAALLLLAIGCGTQGGPAGLLPQTDEATATGVPGEEGPEATEEAAPSARPSETPAPAATAPPPQQTPTVVPESTSPTPADKDAEAVATAVVPADNEPATSATAVTVDGPSPIQPSDNGAPLLDVQVSEEDLTEAALDENAELVDRLVYLRARDAIMPIFEAKLVSAEKGSDKMGAQDLVIGVSIDGEHHAYSVPYLSAREVVNDTVAGKPIAVTW